MHGRLKVRTTEEQQERKRLEREKKLSAYKGAMSECLTRVRNAQYDKVGWKISEEILSSNSDILTLWNYRKSYICQLESPEEELVKLFQKELKLTETGITKNPKSYGSWFHRKWVLLRAETLNLTPVLDWQAELHLCDLFLQVDARNFHCWSFRLFVVDHGKLSKQDELKFTSDKISSNFSNYSAWHYRSKIIETLFSTNQLDIEIFEKELNLITNAVFTDPSDQSAWIYQKWLLLEHQKSTIKTLLFDSKCLSFRFSKDLDPVIDILSLKLNNITLNELKWTKMSDSKSWTTETTSSIDKNFLLQNNIKITVTFKNKGPPTELILEKIQPSSSFSYSSQFILRDINLDDALIAKHLQNIQDLHAAESENGNTSKWCLLTLVEIMQIIDTKKYLPTIVEYLDRLAEKIDTNRKNFYLHLKMSLQNVY